MKKILFAFILLLPFLVYAENCEVITGTGKDIGDEIKCGTESFYVIEYKENQTKMLAKYNLFVGDKIDYFAIDNPVEEEKDPDFTTDTFFEICDELASEKGYHAYYTYPMFDFRKDFDTITNYYTFKGCRVYERIEYDHIRQDSRAVGTILKDGKSVLPLYGITYMVPEWGYEAIVENEIGVNRYDSSGNLVLSGSPFEKYIVGYKEELESQNINVKKVEFFKLNDVIEVLEDITDEEIDVSLYYENDWESTSTEFSAEDAPNEYIGKMDVKDFVGENKWLYSTTYWLGSGFYNNFDEHTNPHGSASQFNDYYLSNEGFLCALGRGMCGYFDYPIGNGVRPVITVKNEDITYTLGDSANQINPAPINPKTKTGFALLFIVLGAASLTTCFIIKKKELN